MHRADTEKICINTIRFLAVDGVEKANSGHPGMPMGTASLAYVLWFRFLKHNPKNPDWPNRDRFILSAGHGSMLLYSLLHLTGYDVSLEDLKSFRQWGSKTPGHPEYGHTPGVVTTTGPLGQGFATGVGMAIAAKYLAQMYNRPGFPLFDYCIYAIAGDGDMMEGISSEAASLAGFLGLNNLVYLYDDNHISIEGDTSLAFTEDVAARFEAYGWFVQRVDGHDTAAIHDAIATARAQHQKPSLIIARTHIGYGSPNKQDTCEVHGAPLGPDEVKLTKEALGWPTEPDFYVPDEARKCFKECVAAGQQLENEWWSRVEEYEKQYSKEAADLRLAIEGKLPEGWQEKLPEFSHEDGAVATRSASGKVLNALANVLPRLVGGSADLAPSCNTYMKGLGDFSAQVCGRNFHFGVREHAMGAAMNGMALSKALVPYGGTFLVFSDYMRPSVRLAALMGVRAIYVFTHDSFLLGEDGPTHQPVEHVMSLRMIPNLWVFRPADANETAVAWKVAIERQDGPTALILSRQKLPVLDRSKFPSADNAAKGAYILADTEVGSPEVILIATGSEVHMALEARQKLAEEGIRARVVDMPCCELFEQQTEEYRNQVLPPEVTARVSIEAGTTLGWERYVGFGGDSVGLDRFGASAPEKVLKEKFGFTGEAVAARVRQILQK